MPPLVDLGSVARESMAESMSRAEAKNIDLGLDEQDASRVRAQIEDLRLILNNALDNAIRCTPQRGIVTVRVRAEGTDAVLEIEDTGPGIPAEHRLAVFEPFRRLGNSGEGSGLGLSIAGDAAARLGGAITLGERASGKGLIFRYRQRRA
jgi:signal transduction histidine kinase